MWSLWSSLLLPSVTPHPQMGKKDTWRHPFKYKMKWTHPPIHQQKEESNCYACLFPGHTHLSAATSIPHRPLPPPAKQKNS